jgi:hypothetical protein
VNQFGWSSSEKYSLFYPNQLNQSKRNNLLSKAQNSSYLQAKSDFAAELGLLCFEFYRRTKRINFESHELMHFEGDPNQIKGLLQYCSGNFISSIMGVPDLSLHHFIIDSI